MALLSGLGMIRIVFWSALPLPPAELEIPPSNGLLPELAPPGALGVPCPPEPVVPVPPVRPPVLPPVRPLSPELPLLLPLLPPRPLLELPPKLEMLLMPVI